MPSINADTLLDIVGEIGRMYSGKQLNKALTKFMLSGKEPFAATLRYFSKADCVEIIPGGFRVHGKNWTFDGIPFFLQPILNVLISNVTKINVNCCSPNRLTTLDKFITKNLREIAISGILPPKQMALLQECKLDKIQVTGLLSRHAKILYKCFTITASVHELKCNYTFIANWFSMEWIFDKVEKLTIHYHDDIDYNLIKKFVEILSRSFPNLKSIQANFFNKEKPRDSFYFSSWAYPKIEPQIFNGISSGIKGKFCFTLKSEKRAKEMIFEKYGLDKKLKVGKKTFDIHDGLTVEINIE